jgi:hypothetical protein
MLGSDPVNLLALRCPFGREVPGVSKWPGQRQLSRLRFYSNQIRGAVIRPEAAVRTLRALSCRRASKLVRDAQSGANHAGEQRVRD